MNGDISTLRLPDKPSLDQLRKQAKELKASGNFSSLSDAQLALAQRYGFASWPKLKLGVLQKTLRNLIEDGEAGPVEAFVKANPRLVNLPFDTEEMPIHVAAFENRPGIIEVLARHGARFDAKFSNSGHSALSWAITCWAFDGAKKMVELGHEPDLFCAAGLGDLDRVKAFWVEGRLKNGASKTGSSRYSDSGERLPSPPLDEADVLGDALYIACRADRLEVARFLLERGADPNFRGYAGGTCLHWAEFSDNAELCALLRENGGSNELLDHLYHAPPKVFSVMVLAGWGFFNRLAERLKADPSIVHLKCQSGTPLHAVAYDGQLNTAKLLLACGADKTAKNEAGKTPAEAAKDKGHEELAALLS